MAYIKHLISSKIFLVAVLFLSTAFLFLKSCQNPDVQENPELISSLNYTSEKFEIFEVLPNVNGHQDGDTTHYSVEYVKFEDSTLNQFIKSFLLLNEGVENLEEDAHKFFQTQIDNRQDTSSTNFPWDYYTTLEVNQINENYVGLSVENYTYSGGAHGNNYELYFHWDPVLKKEIQFTELLDTLRLIDINPIGESVLRKQNDLKDTESLSEKFFFENGQFYFPKNARIDNNGDIVFLYNIYEILPYSDGRTALQISYEDIYPALTDKGKEIVDFIKQSNDKK